LETNRSSLSLLPRKLVPINLLDITLEFFQITFANSIFASFTPKQWATLVNLKRFCSSPRQKKKPKPTYDPKHPHRSTARLLQQRK
jgi:hypothetical protein